MILRLTFKPSGLLLGALCALILPMISNAQSLCVQLMSKGKIERSVPVHLGSTLYLSFRHSIYGSQVEEVFALGRDGFLLTELRYSEARLVEFYGHESARRENGVWIVKPTVALLSALNLRLSADAVMSLRFAERSEPLELRLPPGDTLRLSIASCKSSAHG